jgi:hypothetical protein
VGLDANTKSPVSEVSKLTLLVDQNWSEQGADARTLEFLGVVKAVGNEKQAIQIRVARLLAWAKTQDVQQAGYPGWAAFRTEHSPWRVSQTRAYVRLAQSELDVVQEAVSNNEIEFTLATGAVGALGTTASREAQIRWLREAMSGGLPDRHRGFMEVLSGQEMRRVLKARKLGEILIGGDAPTPAIDHFLIECHAQTLTSDQILERARATPPIPDRLGEAVPDWRSEPSMSLLGPWSEPTDVMDAAAKLRATAGLLDQRRVLLGMAYHLVRDQSLWRFVPECNSVEELCRVHLGIAQRTFQDYARNGRILFKSPRLRKEIAEGLTFDRAMFAGERSGGSELTLDSWLELVRRLGRAELHRVEERDVDVRKEYGPALALARAVESIVRRGSVEAREIGGTAARIAEHLLAVGATGPIQVALRDNQHRRSREPAYIFAPPKLLAAADYVLETVVLPPAFGTRRIVEHDQYTCQNPRCRRRTLRVHPHHMHQRQHGGSDEPSNTVTVCPACHLRGIHSGQMSVIRTDDWLVWTWRDGSVALQDSPVSELVFERRTRRTRADGAGRSQQPGPGGPV